MLKKITEAEINERSMAKVSTTPGRKTAFGESKMDPEALKLRFDRLGRFLAGKINEILGSIEDGSIAEYIYVDHNGNKISVEQFITNLLNGDVDNIRIKINGKIVYLTEFATQIDKMYDDLLTGDLAKQLIVVDNITLKSFYAEFKRKEDLERGEPGKSAYDYAVEGGYIGTEVDFSERLASLLSVADAEDHEF